MCKEGPGKEFIRLGRVRELYFHRIREEFVSYFTRIGTEVAPLLPHARSGEVLVAIGDGGGRRYESVVSFSHSDEFVWEIGPVRIVTGGKAKATYVYQTSRQFVAKLGEELLRLLEQHVDWADSIRRSMNHLNDMTTYMALVRPIPPGVRGQGNSVEIKKAVERSKRRLNSNADLLILTFVD